MNQPPWMAQWVLRAFAPRSCREFLVLDLDEEFHAFAAPARGADRARRWYWRQTLRSIPTLISLRISAGEWPAVWLALLVSTAGQVLAMDYLWCAVLSAVPLKDTLERGSIYISVSLAFTFLLNIPVGFSIRTLVPALACAMGMTWLAAGEMHGQMPGWFPAAASAACALGMSGGRAMRAEMVKMRRTA